MQASSRIVTTMFASARGELLTRSDHAESGHAVSAPCGGGRRAASRSSTCPRRCRSSMSEPGPRVGPVCCEKWRHIVQDQNKSPATRPMFWPTYIPFHSALPRSAMEDMTAMRRPSVWANPDPCRPSYRLRWRWCIRMQGDRNNSSRAGAAGYSLCFAVGTS